MKLQERPGFFFFFGGGVGGWAGPVHSLQRSVFSAKDLITLSSSV